ncbi:IS3 family transposase [Kibdelosporangium philippinense]|uniref:IS3 family transposase n=1 Tax=Kibdelosporangium philippinense TaxID=211113 RepID=UPI0035568DF5
MFRQRGLGILLRDLQERTRPHPALAPTVKHLKKETFDWIETYYNTQRRHSTLGYLTPREYELGYREISQIAA